MHIAQQSSAVAKHTWIGKLNIKYYFYTFTVFLIFINKCELCSYTVQYIAVTTYINVSITLKAAALGKLRLYIFTLLTVYLQQNVFYAMYLQNNSWNKKNIYTLHLFSVQGISPSQRHCKAPYKYLMSCTYRWLLSKFILVRLS